MRLSFYYNRDVMKIKSALRSKFFFPKDLSFNSVKQKSKMG